MKTKTNNATDALADFANSNFDFYIGIAIGFISALTAGGVMLLLAGIV
ncbi:hypothetical protein [Xanthomonas phage XPP1]|uniref:Uncharacterized protein n=2 Tax=Tsukubavirus TaxID=2948935 RepID=A0A3S7I695_9CAUD|nr:hypothetical protein KEM11_gp52 [Xanthomonas phage XPP1]YP_010052492.1 hypothetical protein KEM12_gp11 [Xanthomonas phage XPV1]AVO23749.1 hypothetical protein [Xanthomonas phage XPP2]AVO23826.1 hypothetical protein [Xanthomonas phage XPP3]AVO23916.1 hypothetical protein [Xanthomonas phage XPP4]AVO23953.1 hypothetical protein [Xanthomonas phage XPP6]AVO24070.1 hypothetical protein [Xanthomonas phage XPP8]AVO24134.1 hypothetical protein [Xanthomonas phage XPP9]AVO24299.1 hypothetical prote